MSITSKLYNIGYKSKILRGIYRNLFYKDRIQVLLYPSFKCNYNCSYCYVKKGKLLEKFGEEHTGKEWAKQLNKFEPSAVSITGGETSLWSLREFLENIDKKHIVFVTSNLSFDLESTLLWLKKIKGLKLSLSFHPEMIDADEFISRFKQVKKAGIFAISSIVAHPDILPKLKYYKEKFKAENIPFDIQTYLSPNFNYDEEDKRMLLSMIDTNRDEIFFDFDSNPKPKKCSAGLKYYFFAPNGDAYMCQSGFLLVNSKLHDKWKAKKSEFFLGNIFNGTFKPKNIDICNYPCSEYCDLVFAKPKLVGFCPNMLEVKRK